MAKRGALAARDCVGRSRCWDCIAFAEEVPCKAIAVEPEQLIIDVRKTSDSHAHAKGRQSIPRDQTKSLVVNRPTVRWRIVGVSVGAAAGVPVGVVAAFEKEGIFSHGNSGTGIFASWP